MSKDFRFPPQATDKDTPPPPVPDLPSVPRGSTERPPQHASSDTEEVSLTTLPVIQTSVEVPPPPPVDKERSPVGADIDEDVGETEEISLN